MITHSYPSYASQPSYGRRQISRLACQLEAGQGALLELSCSSHIMYIRL